MTRFGFHASHEQIDPRQLLADVQRAEQAGFEMAMCSDHFSPWTTAQGHSGYTWAWLGAALATTDLALGCVCAPGQRYHPAVVAQKVATLGQMFPGRFWVALGSGEASNEHITGDGWPRKEVRTQRLEECVDVIRRMLHGEEVSHDGLVQVDRARLWERADPVPLLVGPAVSVESAARVAQWADGLVTVNQPVDTLRQVVGRLPRGRWSGTARPAGAPQLGRHRRRGDGPRPGPVGGQRRRPAGVLGHRQRGGLRRDRGASPPRGGPRPGARLVRPRPAPRLAARVCRARLRRHLPAPRGAAAGGRSSTRSASTSSPSSGRADHARSPTPATCGGRPRSSTASTSRPSTTATVTAIGDLGGPGRTRRLPRRAGHHLPVADALLPHARPRRRLRRHRPLRRRPRAWAPTVSSSS